MLIIWRRRGHRDGPRMRKLLKGNVFRLRARDLRAWQDRCSPLWPVAQFTNPARCFKRLCTPASNRASLNFFTACLVTEQFVAFAWKLFNGYAGSLLAFMSKHCVIDVLSWKGVRLTAFPPPQTGALPYAFDYFSHIQMWIKCIKIHAVIPPWRRRLISAHCSLSVDKADSCN